jgi:quercetin dioxygenase-like cupin family protein
MKFEHYESGLLYGVRYEFKPGEYLSKHEHSGDRTDQAHNIIVLAGSVILKTEENGSLKLTVGTVHDFDGSQPHSIFAPESAVILNLMLHGKPASFADYTDEQKRGEI